MDGGLIDYIRIVISSFRYAHNMRGVIYKTYNGYFDSIDYIQKELSFLQDVIKMLQDRCQKNTFIKKWCCQIAINILDGISSEVVELIIYMKREKQNNHE